MADSNPNNNTPPISHIFRGGFSITIVIFSYYRGQLKILLEKKDEEPIRGELGHLGRLMLANEDTERALDRLLLNAVGFVNFYKKQLAAFTKVDRHSLGRVVTLVHYGLIPWEKAKNISSENLSWTDLDKVPNLCYDHDEILKTVQKRFCKGLLRHPIVFELLATEFILSDVIKIYEEAFSTKIDVSNFRKQMRKSDQVIPLGKYLDMENHHGRKPELHSFNKKKYTQSKENIQFNF